MHILKILWLGFNSRFFCKFKRKWAPRQRKLSCANTRQGLGVEKRRKEKGNMYSQVHNMCTSTQVITDWVVGERRIEGKRIMNFWGFSFFSLGGKWIFYYVCVVGFHIFGKHKSRNVELAKSWNTSLCFTSYVEFTLRDFALNKLYAILVRSLLYVHRGALNL